MSDSKFSDLQDKITAEVGVSWTETEEGWEYRSSSSLLFVKINKDPDGYFCDLSPLTGSGAENQLFSNPDSAKMYASAVVGQKLTGGVFASLLDLTNKYEKTPDKMREIMDEAEKKLLLKTKPLPETVVN